MLVAYRRRSISGWLPSDQLISYFKPSPHSLLSEDARSPGTEIRVFGMTIIKTRVNTIICAAHGHRLSHAATDSDLTDILYDILAAGHTQTLDRGKPDSRLLICASESNTHV